MSSPTVRIFQSYSQFQSYSHLFANLLRYLYSATFGLINRSEFKIEETLTLREDFFLFLFRHQLVPIGYVPEVLLTQEDKEAWRIYEDFVQGTKTDESLECDQILKEWGNKLKNKKLKEFDHDKLENILRCKCNNLFSNWGDLETGQLNRKIVAKDCLEILQILKPNKKEISYSLQASDEDEKQEKETAKKEEEYFNVELTKSDSVAERSKELKAIEDKRADRKKLGREILGMILKEIEKEDLNQVKEALKESLTKKTEKFEKKKFASKKEEPPTFQFQHVFIKENKEIQCVPEIAETFLNEDCLIIITKSDSKVIRIADIDLNEKKMQIFKNNAPKLFKLLEVKFF
uniref:Uncharacterized protein n=1 Tax=Meloidogyne incognita TaxID=6306 RepID=A0A914M1J3_MELIC